MRISAPPIRHPCHYGIDMSTREEMVAHGRTVEEIAAELGCDSLAYLSLEGVYEAIRGDARTHCDACFTGEYPLERTDEANGKFALEGELPLVRAWISTAALREHFGFDAFRPGRSARRWPRRWRAATRLVVMPTGSGKSLCYQLPALMRDDLTLVVSPLVSLMQDQVEALAGARAGAVALVNAQQDAGRQPRGARARPRASCACSTSRPSGSPRPGFAAALAQARDRALRGRRGALRLAVGPRLPARLLPPGRRRPLPRRARDRRLDGDGDAAGGRRHRAPPRAARPGPRGHRLRPAQPVLRGRPLPGARDKRRRLAAALREPGALPAIVYAGTRAGTEELAGELSGALGEPVAAYHAGLPRDARAAAQRRFMAGEAPVVVATNAFGMGVDKADVRTVVHETVPGSLEAFYQEAGRAGRDGAPARCLLFAEKRDKGLHVFFIERAEGRRRAVRPGSPGAWRSARGDGRPLRPRLRELAGMAGCDDDQVGALIGHLARAGVLQPAPGLARPRARPAAGPARRRGARALPHLRRRGPARALAPVPRGLGLRRGARCRRETILRHFGDRRASARPVGRCCDVCDPGAGRGGRRAGRRRAARARRRRPRRRDRRGRGRRASPRSGARARSRSCAAGARR